MQRLLIVFQWSLWFLVVALQVYSICKHKPSLIVLHLIPLVLQIRLYLPMLDLEKRRETYTTLEITSMFNIQLYGMIVGQILLNIVVARWLGVVTTISTIFMLNYGMLRWTSPKESMMKIVQENTGLLIYSIFAIVLALFVTGVVLYTYHHDSMAAINQTLILQEEIERVLRNLDETIVCKPQQGISFCNNVGFSIL